ncbi:DUF3265 domain-containing protein [Vibrio europaeus]|nr:DUF3265 domain-containing protein [Vibrio europaeus]
MIRNAWRSVFKVLYGGIGIALLTPY